MFVTDRQDLKELKRSQYKDYFEIAFEKKNEYSKEVKKTGI